MALLDTTFLIDLMKEAKKRRAGPATVKRRGLAHFVESSEQNVPVPCLTPPWTAKGRKLLRALLLAEVATTQ